MSQELVNSSSAQAKLLEEVPNENDTTNNATNANEHVLSQHYDPAQYQNYFYQDEDGNYYYQDVDGNYYYYADNPDQRGVDDEATGESVRVSPGPGAGGLRTDDIDNWQPESTYCFVDVVTDVFLCVPFRFYLTLVLACGFILIILIGLDCTLASLYRIFVVPNQDMNIGIQVLAYFCVFIYLSFITVSVICLGMDMVRALWWQRRKDVSIWGMSHVMLTNQLPPVMFYLTILVVTIVLPFFWAVVETLSNTQSFVYIAQRFSNVAVLATLCLIAACYAQFYFSALMSKYRAVRHVRTRDDYALRQRQYQHRPEKLSNAPYHWYQAYTILEEFGLDPSTLRYNSLVFTLGCLPIFAVLTGQRMSTRDTDPSIEWALIACVVMMCVYLISWITLLHTKWHWAIYVSIMLIILFIVLGLIGGIVGSASVLAIQIVFIVLAQGLLTRKRNHKLTARELASELQFVPARQTGGAERDGAARHAAAATTTAVNMRDGRSAEVGRDGATKASPGGGGAAGEITLQSNEDANTQELRSEPFDSYLCCCRDVLYHCLSCFHVHQHFVHLHPDVRSAQRRYSKAHMTLRSDQKVLCVWWLLVMFAIAFVVAIGNGMSYHFRNPIAVTQLSTDATLANDASMPAVDASSIDLCNVRFNTLSATPLTMYDVSLLAALSYTYGSNGNSDFNTWFTTPHPTLVRSSPIMLPATLNGGTDSTSISYSVYLDVETNFKVVTLNSNTRGMSVFRDMDDWGTSIALQVAGVFVPMIAIWPERYRAAFVRSVSYFKRWMGYPDTLGDVKAYLERVIRMEGSLKNVVLVGDSFNGGYVKILASEYQVTFAAFNAPGVRYVVPGIASGERGLLSGYQVTNARSLLSYIDSLVDTQDTTFLTCPMAYSSSRCSRITTTVENIYTLCGDVYKRTINA